MLKVVSETLQSLLEAHAQGSMDVVLKSPIELGSYDTSDTVSLWLYRVTHDVSGSSQLPTRASITAERLPLLLKLHYLVIPMADAPESQAQLELALEAFWEHPIVMGTDLAALRTDLPEDLIDSVVELRVQPEMLSLEDMTRIWNALDMPYQLSVAYEVEGVVVGWKHDP